MKRLKGDALRKCYEMLRVIEKSNTLSEDKVTELHKHLEFRGELSLLKEILCDKMVSFENKTKLFIEYLVEYENDL